MPITLDDDAALGLTLNGLGGSLVRACLEEALIDVDGHVVQRLSSPDGSVPQSPADRVRLEEASSATVHREAPKIGIGGVLYAKAVREASADKASQLPWGACHVQEPHPEPGPSDKASAKQTQLQSRPHEYELAKRLQPVLAAPPRVRDQPVSFKRLRARPAAADAAIVASPVAPTPGAASSRNVPQTSPPKAPSCALPQSFDPTPAGVLADNQGYANGNPERGALVGIGGVAPRAQVFRPPRHARVKEDAAGVSSAAVPIVIADRHRGPANPATPANPTTNADESISNASVFSISPYATYAHEKRSHIVSNIASPAALDTREILQGALEEEAAHVVDNRSPSSRIALSATNLNRNDSSEVRHGVLPKLANPVSQREVANPQQRGDHLPPIVAERREVPRRGTPLYLRMQRAYDVQEQRIFVSAQERRRAEVAGLVVSAGPAPCAVRKIRRSSALRKVKVRAPRRKRVLTKKGTKTCADDRCNPAPAAIVASSSTQNRVESLERVPEEGATPAMEAVLQRRGETSGNRGAEGRRKKQGQRRKLVAQGKHADAKHRASPQPHGVDVPEVEQAGADEPTDINASRPAEQDRTIPKYPAGIFQTESSDESSPTSRDFEIRLPTELDGDAVFVGVGHTQLTEAAGAPKEFVALEQASPQLYYKAFDCAKQHEQSGVPVLEKPEVVPSTRALDSSDVDAVDNFQNIDEVDRLIGTEIHLLGTFAEERDVPADGHGVSLCGQERLPGGWGSSMVVFGAEAFGQGEFSAQGSDPADVAMVELTLSASELYVQEELSGKRAA